MFMLLFNMHYFIFLCILHVRIFPIHFLYIIFIIPICLIVPFIFHFFVVDNYRLDLIARIKLIRYLLRLKQFPDNSSRISRKKEKEE